MPRTIGVSISRPQKRSNSSSIRKAFPYLTHSKICIYIKAIANPSLVRVPPSSISTQRLSPATEKWRDCWTDRLRTAKRKTVRCKTLDFRQRKTASLERELAVLRTVWHNPNGPHRGSGDRDVQSGKIRSLAFLLRCLLWIKVVSVKFRTLPSFVTFCFRY